MTRQCNKWREAPAWLGYKIDNIKLSYRIHKKYRAVFESLSSKNNIIEKQSRFNLMAIFWIVYLFVKNKSKEDITTIDVTNILYCLFVWIFGEVITKLELNEDYISYVFKSQFLEFNVPSEQLYYFYKQRMFEELKEIHDWRKKG